MKIKGTKIPVLITILLLCNAAMGQNKYGDLNIKVSPTKGLGTNITVLAIDKDLSDTTFSITGANGEAIFENLFISGTDGMKNRNWNTNYIEGNVEIFTINGQKHCEIQSENGAIKIYENNKLKKEGIYLARDENNNTIKFFYGNRPIMLGKETGKFKSGINSGESNLYEIVIDGSGREFNPFIYKQEVIIYVGTNHYEMHPSEYTEDVGVLARVEVLVDGKQPGTGANVTFSPVIASDSSYSSILVDGKASFSEDEGIKSHPYGSFPRKYSVLIHPKTININRFKPTSYTVEVGLDSNDYFFYPEPFPVIVKGFEDIGDGWELPKPGAAGSSGLTITPDYTLLIIDFFDDYIWHHDTKGNELSGGFRIPNTAAEGGTYDPTDNTIWLIDAQGDDVEHFSLAGEHLTHDTFEVGSIGLSSGLGIVFDPTDNTLWIADSKNDSIYHFSRKGNKLDDGFKAGPNIMDIRGMCFDPRDSTLVLLNSGGYSGSANRLNKFERTEGLMIWESSNLSNLLEGLRAPEGVVFDQRDSTFWINGLFTEEMHHVKEQ